MLEAQDGRVQVDVVPAKPAELAPPSTGGHRGPDEGAPVLVDSPCLVEDPDRFPRVRRRRVWLGSRWWICLSHGAYGDPLPPHRALESAGKQVVDLAYGGRAERLALVRLAAVIALVLAAGPMVDAALAGAVITTPAQLGVQRVEGVGVELTHLDLADVGQHVFAGGSPVAVPGRRFAVEVLVQVASRSCSTVAVVFGLRRSSTSLSSRVRTRSASRSASGPAGTTSTSRCRCFVTGSRPAETLTRRDPFGKRSIAPRCRRFFERPAMPPV